MTTIKIDLRNYRGLWKNLVNAMLAPMTPSKYLYLTRTEQDTICDELHDKLESTFGFKIIYANGGSPASVFAQCLEFPDAQQAENFINFTIPKYLS